MTKGETIVALILLIIIALIFFWAACYAEAHLVGIG